MRESTLYNRAHLRVNTMPSVKEALKAFRTWYGVLGSVIAILALINFSAAIFRIEFTEFLQLIVNAYRGIAHTIVDWLFFWVPFKVPTFVKDGVVLWLIFGGAFARTQDRFMIVRSGSLWQAYYVALGRRNPTERIPDRSPYLEHIYNVSPRW
jgi:hypothetical protein